MSTKLSYFEEKIGIIGLGYVGLPLALAFSKMHKVVGYDILVFMVAHEEFKENSLSKYRHLIFEHSIIMDPLSLFPRDQVCLQL
jgi:UDP-N-acetyl-D-mannosaminuronate dehydrogenase